MLRKDIFKKREDDDHIVRGAMKACFIQLVGGSIQPYMRVLVMGYQGVDGQFRRDRQRKKREQPACYYPSYGAMLEQSSF